MTEVAPTRMKNRFIRRCRSCQKWIPGGHEMIYYGSKQGISHVTTDACAAAPDDWVVPTFDDAARRYHRERTGALLEAHQWTFAKTMPDTPHFWTLRKQWDSGEDFEYCVGMIRALGQVRKFFSASYVKFDFGEFEYWTCGPVTMHVVVENLINRAVLAQPSLNPISP